LLNKTDQHQQIGSKLIKWYRHNHRELPWRETNDPYRIWLSEIILQQTRVEQGLSYYYKFIDHYPSVKDLAEAPEDRIMKDWQGLGYYSRARNLHAAAKSIMNDYHGQFPTEYDEIRALKGVGDYTAAAIASFAYHLPYPVVDGNVYRFLARLFGLEIPINTPQAKREFTALAHQLFKKENIAEFNQAIMEFGALQCVPQKPKCENCPFEDQCYAKQFGKTTDLPVKKPKIKQRKRFFNYLIVTDGKFILIKKRRGKGIWQNLYDFPLIESKIELSQKSIFKNPLFTQLNSQSELEFLNRSDLRRHILSHQIILAQFFHFETSRINRIKNPDYEVIELSHLPQYPIPKLLENYLREETNFLSL
jgi:A/G-specific adenine glycosylase